MQLADQEYVLAVAVHHIAIDGWSLRLLMQELAQHYSALASRDVRRSCQNFRCNMRTLPIGSVAGSAAKSLESNEATGSISSVKNPPALNLPTDYVYPAVRTFNGEPHYSVIPYRAFIQASRD